MSKSSMAGIMKPPQLMILWECRARSVPAVRPHCKLLYVGNYVNPSFGVFSPVGCSITELFTLFVH